MQRTYSQLDLNDRRKLARWRGMGLSVDVIAEKLGRHRSTIFRELRRNAFNDKDWPELDGYHCVTAHDMARERRTRLRKLARFSHVRQSVIERIQHGWCHSRSRAGCGSSVIRSRSATRRSTSSPIPRTARPSSSGGICRTPRAAPSASCQAPARPALQPGPEHPAPPGRSRRAKAVRALGVPSDPVPPEVRQGECDVAGRAGQPLRGSPAQQ